MASKLFKTLNAIEEGRTHIINTLNENGYNIRKRASLVEVGNALKDVTYESNIPTDPEWVDWERPDYLLEDPVQFLKDAPIIENVEQSTDKKMYPLILYEFKRDVETIILNTNNFTTSTATRGVVGFKTSDGKLYSLHDGTIVAKEDLEHNFPKDDSKKWVILYGGVSLTNAASSSDMLTTDLKAPSFMEQVEEIVVGDCNINLCSLYGSSTKEYPLKSVIFSELYLPYSTSKNRPGSRGTFTNLPNLENFDAPGIASFSFHSSPNYPFRESRKLTHFNIENMKKYNGEHIAFPSISGASSVYNTDGDPIKYVKVSKDLVVEKGSIGSRLSRHNADMSDYKSIISGLSYYAYEASYPLTTDKKSYTLKNAMKFHYQPNSEFGTITLSSARFVDFSKPCRATAVSAPMAIEMDLTGVLFTSEYIGEAPLCQICRFPYTYEHSVDIGSWFNLSRESVLDLFNKVHTITEEEEAKTITLPYSVYVHLTEEDINIVTSKGWEINQK